MSKIALKNGKPLAFGTKPLSKDYTGISPVVVDNTNNQISLNKGDLITFIDGEFVSLSKFNDEQKDILSKIQTNLDSITLLNTFKTTQESTNNTLNTLIGNNTTAIHGNTTIINQIVDSLKSGNFFIFKGSYVAGTKYQIGEVVEDHHILYLSLIKDNDTPPREDATKTKWLTTNGPSINLDNYFTKLEIQQLLSNLETKLQTNIDNVSFKSGEKVKDIEFDKITEELSNTSQLALGNFNVINGNDGLYQKVQNLTKIWDGSEVATNQTFNGKTVFKQIISRGDINSDTEIARSGVLISSVETFLGIGTTGRIRRKGGIISSINGIPAGADTRSSIVYFSNNQIKYNYDIDTVGYLYTNMPFTVELLYTKL